MKVSTHILGAHGKLIGMVTVQEGHLDTGYIEMMTKVLATDATKNPGVAVIYMDTDEAEAVVRNLDLAIKHARTKLKRGLS